MTTQSMTDAAAPFFSANDLVRMLFGVLIVSGAVFSILLFLARFRRRDFSFLYFGLGAFLYGIRLFVNGSSQYMEHRWDIVDPVVSLLIIIPFFLFFVETVSPHWKRFTWLVITPFIAIALFGFTSLAVHRNIGLVRMTTHVVALVALPIFLVMLFVPFRSTGRDQTILRTGLLIFLLFAVYDNLVN